MIELALALTLQTAPPVGVLLEPRWNHVAIGDWTFISPTTDRNGIVFARHAEEEDEILLRYELDRPEDDFRSVHITMQLDCGGSQVRWIEATGFDEPNLEGVEVGIATPDRWSPAASHSLEEMLLDFGCGW